MPPVRTRKPKKLPANLPADLSASTAAHLLLYNPPNIKEWRQTLWAIKEEIEMLWEDFKDRWPYVTNFWSR